MIRSDWCPKSEETLWIHECREKGLHLQDREASGEASPAHTLILNFHLPEL